MPGNGNLLPSLSGLNIDTVNTGPSAEKRPCEGLGGGPTPKAARVKGPELTDDKARCAIKQVKTLSAGDILNRYRKKVQAVNERLRRIEADDVDRRTKHFCAFDGKSHAEILAVVDREIKTKMILASKWPNPTDEPPTPATQKQVEELDKKVMEQMQQIARDYRYSALAGVLDFPAEDYGLIKKYAKGVDFSNVEPGSELHEAALRIPGVMVIPILSDNEVASWRKHVSDAMDSFPEFRPPLHFNRTSNVDSSVADDFKFVGGGFSALANPSSFHHPTIRALRALVYERVLAADERAGNGDCNTGKSVFGFWDPESENHGRMLEKLSDRLMYRRIGVAPPAESWHRDDALGVDPANPDTNYPADVVYGGWLNLDVGANQYFSCIPYSASTTTRTGSGFGTIKSRAYDDSGNAHERVEMLEWIKHMYRIKVPPGHLLIFDEMTIHEVLATEKPFDSMRLFFGWRISGRNSTHEAAHETDPPTRPMIWNLDQRLDEQQAMPIKSGQHKALNQGQILNELQAKAEASALTDGGAALHLLEHYKKVYTKDKSVIYPCGPNFTTDASWGKVPPNTENGIINLCVKHLNPLLLGIRHFAFDESKPEKTGLRAKEWENLAAAPKANERAYAQLLEELNARINNQFAFHSTYEAFTVETAADGTRHRVANGTVAELYRTAASPKSDGGGGVVCMETPYFDSLQTMQEKFLTRDPRIKMYEPYTSLDKKVHKPQKPHEMLIELRGGSSAGTSTPMEL